MGVSWLRVCLICQFLFKYESLIDKLANRDIGKVTSIAYSMKFYTGCLLSELFVNKAPCAGFINFPLLDDTFALSSRAFLTLLVLVQSSTSVLVCLPFRMHDSCLHPSVYFIAPLYSIRESIKF